MTWPHMNTNTEEARGKSAAAVAISFITVLLGSEETKTTIIDWPRVGSSRGVSFGGLMHRSSPTFTYI